MVANASNDRGAAHELKLLDDTIQALFGMGLKIEYCIALFDESPDEAKAGLDAAISGLSDLIVELRGRIDDLIWIERNDDGTESNKRCYR